MMTMIGVKRPVATPHDEVDCPVDEYNIFKAVLASIR